MKIQTDENGKLSLYDINKQMILQINKIGLAEIDHNILEISLWFAVKQNNYYMLLCHDKRDYTLFHFNNNSESVAIQAGNELKEVLLNRGKIIDIEYLKDDKVYSIWIEIDDEAFLYYLFPYDAGVIEV